MEDADQILLATFLSQATKEGVIWLIETDLGPQHQSLPNGYSPLPVWSTKEAAEAVARDWDSVPHSVPEARRVVRVGLKRFLNEILEDLVPRQPPLGTEGVVLLDPVDGLPALMVGAGNLLALFRGEAQRTRLDDTPVCRFAREFQVSGRFWSIGTHTKPIEAKSRVTGRSVRLIWNRQEDAAAFAMQRARSGRILPVSIEDYTDLWMPDMSRLNLQAGLNCSLDGQAHEIPSDELSQHLLDGESHWDYFLSYAGESSGFVLDLYHELTSLGALGWLDIVETQGVSRSAVSPQDLYRSLSAGILFSGCVVVLITPEFLEKEWPRRELNLVLSDVARGKPLISIWDRVESEGEGDLGKLFEDVRALSVLSLDSSGGAKDLAKRILAERVPALRTRQGEAPNGARVAVMPEKAQFRLLLGPSSRSIFPWQILEFSGRQLSDWSQLQLESARTEKPEPGSASSEDFDVRGSWVVVNRRLCSPSEIGSRIEVPLENGGPPQILVPKFVSDGVTFGVFDSGGNS